MEEERPFSLQGDRAVVVTLGNTINRRTHLAVARLFRHLTHDPITGVVEVVPTYTALTVYYDPHKLAMLQEDPPAEYVCQRLEERMALMDDLGDGQVLQEEIVTLERDERQVVTIPICYDERLAPDLSYVAAYHQMDVGDIVRIHSEGDYNVSMIGFMPGFPYLSGMSEHIATPRQDQPRAQVAAGSVGIAGLQTGIYPMTSPGGWQIIGRTPLALFDPARTVPSVLKFGDRVRFTPMTWYEFNRWG